MAGTTKHPELIQAILAGKHDEVGMDYIIRAADARKKHLLKSSGIVKGARVVVADDKIRAGEFAGKTGRVVKLNPKRVTVAFPCSDCGSDKEIPVEAGDILDRCTTCHGFPDQVNIPTDLLAKVAA